jgi:hypothetical protein
MRSQMLAGIRVGLVGSLILLPSSVTLLR